MNILKLKEVTDDHVVYLYQPEGKGSWGRIEYRFSGSKLEFAV